MSRHAGSNVAGPHLRRSEPWGVGLRRVTLECLDEATGVMAATATPVAERVHRVRVLLKRARAVLRLVEALDCSWARTGRLRLSRLARELARTRDHTVLGDTRRKLGLAAPEISAPDGGVAHNWSKALSTERSALARRAWPVISLAAGQAALSMMVAGLRRRESEASGGHKPKRVHAWRKRVIVLRELLNVLHTKLPVRQRSYASRLHLVARKLGGAQDLALLAEAEKAAAAGPAREARLAGLKQRRHRKVRSARKLAVGLTQELEREFGRRVAR